MEMVNDIDKKTLVNRFNKVCKGKATTYVKDKYLGTGGYLNINDDYYIKLIIFPYPKEIIIERVKKYAPYLIMGDTIEEDKITNFKTIDNNILDWIETTTNKYIKECAN